MRLKINFSGSAKTFTRPLNKEVNGLVHKIIGADNEYHGAFSRYSVSSMQGGHMNKDGAIAFTDGGYFFISSDDAKFMETIIKGFLKNKKDLSIFDMVYNGWEIKDFIINDKFDLVRTISPILLSDGKKAVTFHDSNFIGLLTEKSIKKLIKCGYDEKIANTIKFEIFHPENYKTKMVEIKGVKNIANKIMLVVKGDKIARKALYELGLGKCTGFGFGAVSINKNNK